MAEEEGQDTGREGVAPVSTSPIPTTTQETPSDVMEAPTTPPPTSPKPPGEDLLSPPKRSKAVTREAKNKGAVGEGSNRSKPRKWTPQDDQTLKDAAQIYHDFERIHRSVKFAQQFTQYELEERWRALLYDPEVARKAASSIASLPSTSKRVPWAESEEMRLIQEVTINNFTNFQRILQKYRSDFHPSRTAKSLEAHYYRMKRSMATIPHSEVVERARLFYGQKREPEGTQGTRDIKTEPEAGGAPKDESGTTTGKRNDCIVPSVSDFSDVETEVFHSAAPDSHDVDKQAQYLFQEARRKRKILRIEREVERDRDIKALALVRGMRVRHAMRKRKIVIGRATQSSSTPVDVNLAEEGESSKVSRCQAVIKFGVDGEFAIKNVSGRPRPVLVNGCPVESGLKRRLIHNSLIDVAGIQLIFEVNKPLVARIKKGMNV